MALSYKLLRYINSAYSGLTKTKSASIMHAMTLLGAREFKQWASLVVMASMGSDKPNELVTHGADPRPASAIAGAPHGLEDAVPGTLPDRHVLAADAILDRPLEAF